jgi:hypothetical protein
MVQPIKMDEKNLLIDTTNGTNYYKVKAEEEYIAVQKTPFLELTSKDHVWIKVTFDIRFKKEFTDQNPCFVFCMERSNGDYGYFATDLKKEEPINGWKQYSIYYQTPPIRNKKDQLKTYIWKRGKQGFELRNMKMEVFERNRN